MSTFNDSGYIGESIKSVLNQTFTNWELIIFNDASTDDTGTIIKKFIQKDNRIKYFKNSKNMGLVVNLIKGISKSGGEFIARIDGDDTWLDRDKLKKQIEFLVENQEYGLVGSWARVIDSENNIVSFTKNPVTDHDIRRYYLMENCFFHSSVMIRKTVYEKAGGYDPNIKTAEDYDLWLRIGKISKIYNIPEYLISYRINPKGINSTKYNFQINETISLIKKFKDHYPNYKKALFFWHLRRFVPKKIKSAFSDILKSKYLLNRSRDIKSKMLNVSKIN